MGAKLPTPPNGQGREPTLHDLLRLPMPLEAKVQLVVDPTQLLGELAAAQATGRFKPGQRASDTIVAIVACAIWPERFLDPREEASTETEETP